LRLHALLVLAVGLLLAADAKEDTAKKELKKLEGTWQVVSMEMDGQKQPEDEAKQFKVVIKGNKYSLKRGDDTVNQGTFTIDATKKPKTIDIKPSEGDNSGQTMLGIYEQDGDTQKTCYAQPDKKRPTKFSSDDGQTLIVQKRQKAQK
jgi:uncharacterized protein (TIGR03067 family)